MTRDEANRIAALFESRFLQGYIRSKMQTDPVYDAVLAHLRDHAHPIVDVGCGVGLLSFFLRERGVRNRITGIDFDARKIAAAQKAAMQYENLEFRTGDARDPLPAHHSVTLLDLLHYFTTEVQKSILMDAARVVPPGGVVIIRDAIDDGSWRYRMTYGAEAFARLIFWLKAERLNFPTFATLNAAFEGWEREVVPLWGRTPFNNYLLVMRRPSSGITNA